MEPPSGMMGDNGIGGFESEVHASCQRGPCWDLGSVIKEAGRECILFIGLVYSLSSTLSLYLASGLTIGTCPGRPGGLSTFSCPGQKMENPATKKTGPRRAGRVRTRHPVGATRPPPVTEGQSGQKRELLSKGWQGPGVRYGAVRCGADERAKALDKPWSRVAQRLTMGRGFGDSLPPPKGHS